MNAPREERRAATRGGPLLRWYYGLKYWVFRRERQPRDERAGLVVLQIDALAHADLRRALEQGYCPTIERMLGEGYELRRWFCGLPSATPYCQAGILYGENDGIPAFRFYDKVARRVITCNAPAGVQYIRDRIRAPGALAGGSSYVNLLDGDAKTVAFTVATRERLSVYRRLGGTRMALLIVLHPVRVARMVLQGAWEWLREEWDRAAGEWTGRRTHAEGIFPFLRVLTNVVVRELQTIAILLDIHLGVPVIYSTFMQYDELGHHFGPSSRSALRDLRRTDARLREIRRMVQNAPSRRYDIVVLSDHGMTPSASYRVRYRETLGTTVQRVLADAADRGAARRDAIESYAPDTEYAQMGPRMMRSVTKTGPRSRRVRRGVRRLRAWVRAHYGLRELVFPEKYKVDPRLGVVVTYSSCLALVYIADEPGALTRDALLASPSHAALHAALLAHPGIGLVATRTLDSVSLEGKAGRAEIRDGIVHVIEGANPLDAYAGGAERLVARALERLVRQPNAGDLVLFGAYDGYEIVSFDDQIGAHGSAGGDQVWPFLLAPERFKASATRIEDARDLHALLFTDAHDD